MVPPAPMLATKNLGGCCAWLCVALALAVAGCTPAGPRALLDGKRLLEEGQYEPAVEKIKIATSLLGTNAQTWNYLGLAYHRSGQTTNAAAAYQKALDLNRDLLEARYNLGCLWLDLNRPELARAEFTSYTLRRANAVEGWLKLGTAQLRSRDAAGADKSFREALRISQNHVEALNGLGLVQVQRNRPREAVPYFNTALQQQPDYRPALLNLAVVSHQYLKNRSGALRRYRDYLALKPRPDDWQSVSAVAQALEHQLTAPSHTPAATNRLVTAPAIAVTNATKPPTTVAVQISPAKSEVPTIPKKTEAPPPAKTEPQPSAAKPVAAPPTAQTAPVEVVTLPPEPVIRPAPDVLPPRAIPHNDVPAAQSPNAPPISNPPPSVAAINVRGTESPAGDESSTRRYTYLSPAKPLPGARREAERAFAQAQQAQRSNRLTEARQAYRQAAQVDPGYFEAYYNLGLVAFESRNYGESLAAWENALAIQPDSVDARYNFALALKAADYPADAAHQLRQILSANANETRAHLVLGNLCAEQFDDPVQARRHYLKVLELDPRHPQATAIRYWLVGHPP